MLLYLNEGGGIFFWVGWIARFGRPYTNSMQRVSECEVMVFFRAAARLRRAAAPC
jgi:hypothetical protein